MELSKKSLDDLISVADKIIEANRSTEKDLFGEIKNPEEIKKNIRYRRTRSGTIV